MPIVTDPKQIRQIRMYALLKSVSMETIGLTRSGRSATSIAKDHLRQQGMKAPRSKRDTFYALRDWMSETYEREYKDLPACDKQLR